jgi:excisionase family DNA binding protein
MKHYSHATHAGLISEGEVGDAPRGEVWCTMANQDEQPLSEVAFLTVAEVAAAMRVSKMTVYRLVHSGELPAVRVGRSFRVPETAVDEYLRRSYFQAG